MCIFHTVDMFRPANWHVRRVMAIWERHPDRPLKPSLILEWANASPAMREEMWIGAASFVISDRGLDKAE